MHSEVDVGRVVAGKYELVRLIGKGAMGEVWLATHNSLGGQFAIKLVKPGENEDANAAARFQLEAQISAKLSRRTRHIVSVSDHGEESGLAYLVMELLEGESLEVRIARGPEMPLAETVAIVMQVARALEQAHGENIFHRDLKPANLFLTKDEDGRLLVKLLDFGIARVNKAFGSRSAVSTGKDMVLGTPCYMSPEQARGLDNLDYRCDLWALAVVAYEALTQHIPWEGQSVEDIFLSICTHRMTPILERRPDLPPAIEAIYEKAFGWEPDERFGSAAELSLAFEALVDPRDVEAAVMGAPPRAAPESARRRAPSPAAPPLRTDTDPNGLALRKPTIQNRRKKRGSGWLLAAVVALVTVGMILVGVRAFTARDATATTTPSGPPPPPRVPDVIVAPTSDPVASPLATAPAASTAVLPASRVRPRASLGGKEPAPPPHAAAPPPAPVTATAPPPAVVPPATAPTPPTSARSAPTVPDRSGVF